MNKIYAVDPGAPRDAEELISLMKMFGPTRGRFIYDLPTGWMKAALAATDETADVTKLKVREILASRRRAFIRPRPSPMRRPSWIETALALQDYEMLIGARECPEVAVPIDRVLYSDYLPDVAGAFVPRTAEGLADAGKLVFRISPKIIIVDPYLHLYGVDTSARRKKSGYYPVLEAFLRVAAAERVERMTIFVGKRNLERKGVDASNLARDLQLLSANVGADEILFKCKMLEDLPNLPGGHQHARYLLGIGCGLHFDSGFDIGKKGTVNHIHWLGEGELGPLLKLFGLPDA